MSEYCQAAEALGQSLYSVAPHSPVGLLNPLSLGSQITGFFKPLTGASCSTKSSVLTMAGCQISVQGVGVQWTTDKVRHAST